MPSLFSFIQACTFIFDSTVGILAKLCYGQHSSPHSRVASPYGIPLDIRSAFPQSFSPALFFPQREFRLGPDANRLRPPSGATEKRRRNWRETANPSGVSFPRELHRGACTESHPVVGVHVKAEVVEGSGGKSAERAQVGVDGGKSLQHSGFVQDSTRPDEIRWET